MGALVLLLAGKRADAWGHTSAPPCRSRSFVCAASCSSPCWARHGTDRSVDNHLFTWIPVNGFHVDASLLLDPLSLTFVLLITGVGSLIHVYSIGYMEHDPGRRRFFGYLNLFVAAMLILVLADSYLLVYVGWEGVGLASYLLIGFWYYKPTAATAAKKAFIVNRVGDVGLSIAIMLMFVRSGRPRSTRCSSGASGASKWLPHGDRHHAAARCLRQERAVPAADLAARRDGGPDPGLGPHPRRDHGHRRRLPRGAVQPDLRPVLDRGAAWSRSSAPSR